MNMTIEEKLDSLTQTLGVVVSELGNRRGESPSKSAAAMPPKITLTKNLADFDFAEIESSRGCKVVAIIKAPEYVPAAARLAVLNVELSDGRKALVKAPFRASQKSNHEQPATPPATASLRQPSASTGDELATVAAAAFNIESRSGGTEAWRSFCSFHFSKGKSACAAIALPLLSVDPFPNGALPHEKVIHLRGLMTKSILPDVLKVASVSQVAPVEQIAQHLPGTLEAYRGDAELRRTHPTFASYRAFVTATGDAVTRHRLRLEKQSKQPRLVRGEWTLGKIGAHEETWLNDPKLQAEFPTPEGYAAYRRRMG